MCTQSHSARTLKRTQPASPCVSTHTSELTSHITQSGVYTLCTYTVPGDLPRAKYSIHTFTNIQRIAMMRDVMKYHFHDILFGPFTVIPLKYAHESIVIGILREHHTGHTLVFHLN